MHSLCRPEPAGTNSAAEWPQASMILVLMVDSITSGPSACAEVKRAGLMLVRASDLIRDHGRLLVPIESYLRSTSGEA